MNEEKPEVTAETLVDLPVPQDVHISPDGSKVIYSVSPLSKSGEHEISSLWIADVGKEHSARQLTSGLFSDQSPSWRPTRADAKNGDDCIAFTSDRAKPGESSAIYLVSLRGGEPYPITKTENKKAIAAFGWDSQGTSIAYLSPDEKTSDQETQDKDSGDVKVWGERWDYNRLRCVHVATREVQTLYNVAAHVSDFAWNEQGTEIAFNSQKTPDMNSPCFDGIKFERINVSSKTIAPITQENFPGPAEDLFWSSSKDELFFLAGVTPKSVCTSSAFYKISLKDGSWKKSDYGDVKCAMGLQKHGRSIGLHLQNGLYDEIVAATSADADSFDLVLETRKVDSWDILHVESTLTTVVVTSDISSPAEVFSTQGGSLCQLSQHGSAATTFRYGVASEIKSIAEDGIECDGIFVRPSASGGGTKPAPTIVLVHGGPYGRITVAFDILYFYWGPYLVSAGYSVLCPNYRGGSSHGDKYAKQAPKALGQEDFGDVLCLLNKGIAEGLIDKERVAIGGWSQGGFLSYVAVTKPDFQFKAAICGAGVVDWDMMAMTSDAYWFEAELSGKAPWETDASNIHARKASPIWHMQDVKTPILILHGENDERVPYTQAVAFHRGCLHHHVPCEFVTYPKEGHVIKERKHVIDMLKRIRRFCDSHLK